MATPAPRPPFPFLSPAWIAAAQKVRDEYRGDTGSVPPLRANLVVTEVPFDDGGELAAHLDSSGGSLELAIGHLDAPDATITVDYVTARTLFVGQDPQAFLQAFLGGKIRLQGDLAKLMALQAAAPSTPDGMERAQAAARALQSITAD